MAQLGKRRKGTLSGELVAQILGKDQSKTIFVGKRITQVNVIQKEEIRIKDWLECRKLKRLFYKCEQEISKRITVLNKDEGRIQKMVDSRKAF